jgi:hypothetical protein
VLVALSNPNYVVAGSFVRFLIENYGDSSETDDTRMGKFRDVYFSAPPVPFEPRPGSANRWNKSYGKTLADVQDKWREYLNNHYSHADCQ